MIEEYKKVKKLKNHTVNKLKEAFAIGASVLEACFWAEISRQTYYNWIKGRPDLKEKFDRLKLKPVLKARQEVVRGLENNPQFSLQYLERKRKKEFSTRVESKVDGNLDIKNTNYNHLTDEELKARIRRVTGELGTESKEAGNTEAVL